MSTEGGAMNEADDTIVVFTARSPDRIIREGGSQAWVLNPARAKQAKWLVCTQNRHHPNHEFSDATEPHGTAFLVGKISGIVPSSEDPDRWMIEISEFARINMPSVWYGRNPVRYTYLLEVVFTDVRNLKFQPMPQRDVAKPVEQGAESASPHSLTIAEAKQALALTFGVKPDAVEITIRG
jgi:hypothetical protein